MRLMLAGIGLIGLWGCVYDPGPSPRGIPAPQPASASDAPLPGRSDKIPDTPYEVRKGEIARDREIAGKTGATYPPLFRKQADKDAQ